MKHKNSFLTAERTVLRSCFELAPNGAPLRGFNFWAAGQLRTPAGLSVLKQRLLQIALEKTALPHVQRQICGAANVAAEMVWDTACPLLLFPCLFQEMATKILNRFVLDEPIDDASPAAPDESDPAYEDIRPDFEWPSPFSDVELTPGIV